jgi:hypothetical protein
MRRFSIRSLMALICLVAVGSAALLQANPVLLGVLLVAALYSVGAAILSACMLRKRERHFSAAYALFAGAYLLIAFGPALSESVAPLLITTQLLHRFEPPPMDAILARRAYLTDVLHQLEAKVRSAEDPQMRAVRQKLDEVNAMIGPPNARSGDPASFNRIGHCLFAIVSGLLGGFTALWLYARRERSE